MNTQIICIATISFFSIGALLKLSAGINDGLVGYWPLNGDALDYSGNGYDGTLVGYAQLGDAFVSNPDGDGSLVLQTENQSDKHIEVTLPTSLHVGAGENNFEASGSVWVWFDDRDPDVYGGNYQPVLGDVLGVRHLRRQLSGNRLRASVRAGDNNANYYALIGPADTLNLENRWYHITWTITSNSSDGSGELHAYIDGIPYAITNLSSSGTYNVSTKGTTDLKIGADYEGYSANLKIAELRLYDRILTAEEMGELASGMGTATEVIESDSTVQGNIYADGVLTLGDYDSTVDELLNTQEGTIRFNGSDVEAYRGGAWVSLTSALHGVSDPDPARGLAGDFYFNTTDGTFHTKQADGTWLLIGSLNDESTEIPSGSELVSVDDDSLTALSVTGSSAESLLTTIEGKVRIKKPQGDISMGLFTSDVLVYQSDFSAGIDGWYVPGEHDTVISSDGSALHATDDTRCVINKDGVLHGATLRITAETSGSSNITIRNWSNAQSAWVDLVTGWDGNSSVTINPISSGLQIDS